MSAVVQSVKSSQGTRSAFAALSEEGHLKSRSWLLSTWQFWVCAWLLCGYILLTFLTVPIDSIFTSRSVPRSGISSQEESKHSTKCWLMSFWSSSSPCSMWSSSREARFGSLVDDFDLTPVHMTWEWWSACQVVMTKCVKWRVMTKCVKSAWSELEVELKLSKQTKARIAQHSAPQRC